MKRLSCLITAAALAAGGASAGFRYFDKLDEQGIPDAEFADLVVETNENYPARAAGVQSGDRIVGVNGFRLRSSTEFTILKNTIPVANGLVLSVYRNGRMHEFKITGLRIDGMVGVLSRDTPFDLLSQFDSLGIDVEKRFGPAEALQASGIDAPASRSEPGAFGALFDAFGTAAPTTAVPRSRLLSQSERLLQYLPRRAMESLVKAARKGGKDSRTWLSAFVRVYTHLRFEEFSEAGALIQKAGLVAGAPDAFLSELTSFYLKLCEVPPSAESGPNLSHYGVDAATFVLCYPFPVIPEYPVGKPFSVDPEFQELFDVSLYGSPAARSRAQLGSIASTMALSIHPQNSAEDYLRGIKTALICPSDHGGWPFRMGSVTHEGTRVQLLARIKEMWNEFDDGRTLLALGLICPSILEGDLATFEMAYRLLVDLGLRERGIANLFVFDAFECEFVRQSVGPRRVRVDAETRKKVEAIIAACEAEIDIPGIYSWLTTRSGPLRAAAARGFEFGSAEFQSGLPYYCTTEGSVAAIRAISGVETGLISIGW